MHQRSSLSLIKSILKYPFHHSPKPTSSFLPKLLTTLTNPPSNPPNFTPKNPNFTPSRLFCSNFDKNKVIDEINMKFAEAREEIEAAMDSKETVYYNEEAECARDAVNHVLEMFNGLLSKLDTKEKDALVRSMGLKIEQLKAELKQLDD